MALHISYVTLIYNYTPIRLPITLIRCLSIVEHLHLPKVAVAAAIFFHGVERAHAAVLLQAHAVLEKVFARCLRRARQQRPHHDTRRAQRQGLVDGGRDGE